MPQVKERIEKAVCIACQREFFATEAFVAFVKAGRCESLCPYCDSSHDDDNEPSEEVIHEYEE
jgi:organic radical activating enzyme